MSHNIRFAKSLAGAVCGDRVYALGAVGDCGVWSQQGY
jgi:hypothetical protein